MIEQQHKTPDELSSVNYYCVMRNASEGFARPASFVEPIRRQVEGLLFRAVISRTTLHRDAHYIWVTGIASYEVDARVINPGAFMAMFGKPIKDKSFGEVARDL